MTISGNFRTIFHDIVNKILLFLITFIIFAAHIVVRSPDMGSSGRDADIVL